MKKKKSLIINDDGILAPGLEALVDEFREHELTIVAPETETSGVSQALTLDRALYKKDVMVSGLPAISLRGTPVDCVKFALSVVLDEKPELLLSGINRGSNSGLTLLYSGTVGGALEGATHNIPSIAASLCMVRGKKGISEEGYRNAARYVREVVEDYRDETPQNIVLNVNIPDLDVDEIKGIRITRQASASFNEFHIPAKDPWNRDFYWVDGNLRIPKEEHSDTQAHEDGYISLTPLKFNLTDDEIFHKLRQKNSR